jgi:hypothetical protein
MIRTLLLAALLCAATVTPATVAAAGTRGGETSTPAPRRLSRAALEDKVRGGWAGQMIGVSFGAPTEFKSNGKIIEGPLVGPHRGLMFGFSRSMFVGSNLRFSTTRRS